MVWDLTTVDNERDMVFLAGINNLPGYTLLNDWKIICIFYEFGRKWLHYVNVLPTYDNYYDVSR